MNRRNGMNRRRGVNRRSGMGWYRRTPPPGELGRPRARDERERADMVQALERVLNASESTSRMMREQIVRQSRLLTSNTHRLEHQNEELRTSLEEARAAAEHERRARQRLKAELRHERLKGLCRRQRDEIAQLRQLLEANNVEAPASTSGEEAQRLLDEERAVESDDEGNVRLRARNQRRTASTSSTASTARRPPPPRSSASTRRAARMARRAQRHSWMSGGHGLLPPMMMEMPMEMPMMRDAVPASLVEMILGGRQIEPNRDGRLRGIERMLSLVRTGRGAPPASEAQLGALVSGEFSADAHPNASCTVCMEVFSAGEAVEIMTCSHVFHAGCIRPWLARHNSCPLCRAALSAPGASSSGGNEAGGGNDNGDSGGGSETRPPPSISIMLTTRDLLDPSRSGDGGSAGGDDLEVSL